MKRGEVRRPIIALVLVIALALVVLLVPLKSPTGLQSAEVNEPPRMVAGPLQVNGSITIDLLSRFVDPEGQSLAFEVNDPAVTLVGSTLAFTPPVGASGDYVVNVQVSDGTNTVYKPLTFVVASAAQPEQSQSVRGSLQDVPQTQAPPERIAQPVAGQSQSISDITISAVPSIAQVILNNTNGAGANLNISNASSNLTVFVINATDADSDPVQNITDWRVNGSSLAALNFPFETNVSSVSSGAVRDYSSFGNNATLGNGVGAQAPVWNASGQVGGSYTFDGVDDHVEVSDIAALDTPTLLSASAWVYRTGLNTSTGQIVAKYKSATDDGWFFRFVVNELDFEIRGSSFEGYNGDQGAIPLNQWVQVAFTYNASAANKAQLYVNGLPVTTTKSGSSTLATSSPTPVTIGYIPVDGQYFNGSIDELILYNATLPSQQIAQLYQDGLAHHHVETMVSQQLREQDIWSTCATPNDNQSDGTTVCSNSVTIVNAHPTIAQVILNNSNGAGYNLNVSNASSNLTVFVINATDADNQPVQNITDWRVNGSSIAVLNLPFETNVSSTAASAVRSYSGVGNSGQLGEGVSGNAPVWNSSGKVGGAFTFDGVNDRISVANNASLNFNGSMTVSAWINPRSIASYQNIISQYDISGNQLRFQFYVTAGGGLGAGISANGASAGGAEGAGSFGINTWSLVGLTFNATSGNIGFYINGTNVGNFSTGRNSLFPGSRNLYVGAREGSDGVFDTFFGGGIDEVAIFNSSLSDGQMYQMYLDGNRGRHVESMVSQQLRGSDNWLVAVTPNDQANASDGTTVISNSVVVQTANNTHPTIQQVILNNSNGAAYNLNISNASSNLTVFVINATDADSDPIQNITDFRVFGNSIAPINMPFETNVSSLATGAVGGYASVTNNGTLGSGVLANAPVWTSSGKVGGAYVFDGGDHIFVGSLTGLPPNGPGALTFTGWFKTADSSGDDLVYVLGNAAHSQGYHPFVSGGIFACGFGFAGSNVAGAGVNVADNAWHHFVCAVDASKFQWIYLDGVLKNATQLTTSQNFFTEQLYIGSTLGAGSNFFTGTIDEVAIFNRTLSAAEALKLFNDGNSSHHLEGVVSSELSRGDTWSVAVTPNDNQNASDGSTVLSNSVVIQANNRPTVAQVILNNSNGAGYTLNMSNASSNLTVFVINATDADSDALQNITDFRVNGSSIAVLNMPFETNSSSTVTGAVRDYSLFINNGTLGNGVGTAVPNWTSGQVGGAYFFDGSSDFIRIPDSTNLRPNLQSYSYELWFKAASLPAFGRILWKNSGGASFNGIYMMTSGSNAYFGIGDGTNTAQPGAPVAVNTWYHVVGTYNRATNTASLYLNGTLQSTATQALGSVNYAGDLYVGANNGASEFFNGMIDELRIYNRSLTAQEVNQSYQDGLAGRHATTFVSQELHRSDVWSVAVTPNDQQSAGDGNTTISNNVTIVNEHPTIQQVILNNSNGAGFNLNISNASSNLTVFVINATDADNESIQNITDFRVDGASYATFNMPFETNVSLNTSGAVRDYSLLALNATLGTGVAGTVPVWNSSGRVGGAYTFDGTNDAITRSTVPVALQTNSYAYELWFRIPVVSATGQALFGIGDEATADQILFITANNTVQVGSYRSGAGFADNAYGTTAITANTWHHFVGVRDVSANNLRAYLDGVQTGNSTPLFSPTALYGVAGLIIGGRFGGTTPFGGSIDEVRVYNHTITAQQIAQLYQDGLAGRHPTTVVSNELVAGQNWSVAVTPNDQQNASDGTTVLSNGVVIQASNNHPTIAQVILNNSNGAAYNLNLSNASSNLTVFVINATDADNESVQNITDWRINSTSFAVLNMPFETNLTGVATGAVRDYSTNINNGTLGAGTASAAPTWRSDGQVGGAYQFDGVDDYVSIPNSNSLNLTGDLTISVWVKPGATQVSEADILSKHSNGGFALEASGASNNYYFTWDTTGGGNFVALGIQTTLAPNVWSHFVIVKSGATVTHYVNGTQTATGSGGSGTITTNAFPLTLGEWSAAGIRKWNGVMDEVQIYNRSLSPQQVVSLFNDGVNRRHFTSLVPQELSAGQNWSVAATPNDQQNASDGTTVLSNGVVIQSNNHPTIAQVILNNSNGAAYNANLSNATDNLTVFTINATDADNEAVQNITDWRVNGGSVATLNMPFETNVSSTAAGAVRDYSIYNSSGRLGAGTVANAPVWNSSGKVGGAFSFDGTDYIEMPNQSLYDYERTDRFSLESWIKTTADGKFILAKELNSGTFRGYYYVVNSNKLECFIQGGTGTTYIQTRGNTTINDGQWHHVICAYAGTSLASGVTLYVDGQLETNTVTQDNLGTNSILSGTPVVIAAREGGGGSPFIGSIDEVRIWNRTLTAAEAYQLYFDGNRSKHLETMVSGELAVGNNWTVAVTPNDQRNASDGTTVLSNGVVITSGDNVHPTIAQVILNNSNGAGYNSNISNASSNLTVFVINATDADSDSIQNITDWRVNGTSIAVIDLPFETNSSNLSSGAIRDYSTALNNGTLGDGVASRSPVWNSSGRAGGAYRFDGADDFVVINNSASLIPQTALTVALWVRPNDLTRAGTQQFISNYGQSPERGYVMFSLGGTNSIYWELRANGVCCQDIVSSANLSNGAWHFLVGTYDGATSRLYVNGTLDGSTSIAGTLSSTRNTTLGADNGDPTVQNFIGAIDEVQVFNRTLSAAEIYQMYLDGNRSKHLENVVSGELAVGNNWTVAVTPNDQRNASDGTTVLSNGVVIQQENRAPSIAQVILNSTDGSGAAGNNASILENLTVSFVNATDEDGNTIQNITDWRRNNVSLALINMPFETNTGSLTAGAITDYSQNANNGQLGSGTGSRAPVWNSSGKVGGAFRYDGSDDHINIPDSASLDAVTNSLSISLWVYPEVGGGWYIARRDPCVSEGWGVVDNSFIYRIGGTTAGLSFVSSIPTLQWTHLGVTYDGSTIRLYVNGSQTNSLGITGSFPNNNKLRLGLRELPGECGGGPVGAFTGDLDEVFVSTRALSGAEIAQMYYDGNNRTHVSAFVSNELAVGDVWSVAATPNDATVDGNTTLSNNVTIIQESIVAKADSPDPVTVDSSLLTYNITLSAPTTSLFNLTLTELYPVNVTFVSSQPSPSSGNATFAVPDITIGQSYVVNITLNVSHRILNGTNLTNYVNLSYVNSTGVPLLASANTSTIAISNFFTDHCGSIISGFTLDHSLYCANITVSGGSTITLNQATVSPIEVVVTDTFNLGAGSEIFGDGTGFPGSPGSSGFAGSGAGPGGGVGGNAAGGGAGHGGRGSAGNPGFPGGGAYGSSIAPDTRGSGGAGAGAGGTSGGNGGGAVKIEAVTAVIDGNITVDGIGGGVNGGATTGGGGGSGGTISINSSALSGSGFLFARGGASGAGFGGVGGAGAGGHIMVQFDSGSFNISHATVSPGSGAEVGTLGFIDKDDRIFTTTDGWRWLASDAAVWNYSIINLSNSSARVVDGSLNFTATQVVFADSRLYQESGSGYAFVVNASSMYLRPSNITGVQWGNFSLSTLGVENQSLASGLGAGFAGGAGSSGFGSAGSGPGGAPGINNAAGGAGHGGSGAPAGAAGGSAYDSSLNPSLLGSGGGGAGAGGSSGGNGSGSFFLSASQVEINGSLVADGATGVDGATFGGGGGSGGTIIINTTSLSGSGRISAAGGRGANAGSIGGGGGGGGRILVRFNTTTFNLSQASVAGGAAGSGATPGFAAHAGTLGFIDTDANTLNISQGWRWESADGFVNFANVTISNGTLYRATGESVNISDTYIADGANLTIESGIASINASRFFQRNSTINATSGTRFELGYRTEFSDTNTSYLSTSRLTLKNISVAEAFFNPTTAQIGNLSVNTRLVNNSVRVLSSVIPGLNVSANLSLYNITQGDPFPIVDFADSGNFVPCAPPRCVELSFVNGVFVYSVTGFTSYSSDASVTLTKDDSPDPVTAGETLSYTLFINNSNGNISNVTVIETYPAQVTFNGSQPVPTSGNNTFVIGDITSNGTFQINITVNVSGLVPNGTVLNNTANMTFNNASGASFFVNVSEDTTVISGNNHPTIAQVILNSSDGSGYVGNNASDTENLTVFIINATDADNQPVQNITDWRINGTSIAVLNLPFETNSTNLSAGGIRDYSTAGNNGWLGGGVAANASTWTSGQVGGAYRFDGADDVIVVQHAQSFAFGTSQDYSVDAWVNILTLPPASHGGVIIEKHNVSSAVTFQLGMVENGLILASIRDNALAGAFVYSAASLSLGTWHHLVMTADRDQNISLYVDGVLSNSTSMAVIGDVTTTKNITIGNSIATGGFWQGLNATIDEVGVYNRSLSAQQVYQLYLDGNSSRHMQTLVSSELHSSDVWSVAATPNDNANASDGTTVLSNDVTILAETNQTEAATVKIDSPDPLNLSSTTLLNYSITFNLTNGSASNITFNESYPDNVSFVNATPSPTLGNFSWSAGNLTAPYVYNISILLNVSPYFANGTLLNNSVNVSFNNGTGDYIIQNATAQTTIINEQQCPLNIMTSTTLTENISCPATAVNILSDNVTLDCAGYNISYANSASGNGINVSNRTNVTINNCTVVQGSGAVTGSSAIVFSGTNASSITNSRSTTLAATSNALVFTSSSNNTVVNDNLTGNSSEALIVQTNSNENTFTRDNMMSGIISVRLQTDSNNNTFNADVVVGDQNIGLRVNGASNNSFTNDTLMSNQSAGMSFGGLAENNTVRNSTLTSFSTGGGDGLVMGASYNLIANNIIASKSGSAILVQSPSNTWNNNLMTTNGSPAAMLIDLPAAASNLTNNTVIGKSGGGVEVRSSNNMLTNNLAVSTTNGAGFTLAFGSNNTFFNNTGAASASGVGLIVELNTNNNTFVNNTALANTGQGILFANAGDNAFINTSIFTNATWIQKFGSGTGNNFTSTSFIQPNGTIEVISTVEIPLATTVDIAHLNTTLNKSFLNSTNLSFLNTSAQITLLGVNITGGTFVVDPEDDGTFVTCDSPQCVDSGSSGSTYVFTVSHFTSYAISSNATCPLNVAADTTLASNITCPATAINILADNVALDCAGYSIRYATSSTGNGVNVTGRTNATVKNCVIFLGNNSAGGAGIRLIDANSSTIQNNSVNSSSQISIDVQSSNDNRFVDDVNTPDSYSGINLVSSHHNNFTGDVQYGSGFSAITLQASNDNRIVNSRGEATSNVGIIGYSSYNNTFDNDTGISDSGTGVAISTGTNNTFSNIVASSNSGQAIWMYVGSNNSFTNTSARSNSGIGLRFENGAQNNTFSNTTIRTNGTWLTTIDATSTNNQVSQTLLLNLNGSIQFPQSIVVPASTVVDTAHLNISSNLSRLNSTNLSFLNTSAQITLLNLAFSNPHTEMDLLDNGTFVDCHEPRCVIQSYSGGTLVFNVTGFTSYAAAETGSSVNATFLKVDSPDPVNASGILNYTITINLTGGAMYNTTVGETYPGNVSFLSSEPAPSSGNDTFTIGNLIDVDVFVVNISVIVGSGVIPGTILHNRANVTWQNVTGLFEAMNATADTTVVSCPFNVTQSTTLVADISCPATAIRVLSDNVTLNCAGFMVHYANVSAGNGIEAVDRANVTIANCTVRQDNLNVSSTAAILLNGTNSSRVKNTSVEAGNQSAGIHLQRFSQFDTIENFSVNVSHVGFTGAIGIQIDSGGAGNATIANGTAVAGIGSTAVLFNGGANTVTNVSALGGIQGFFTSGTFGSTFTNISSAGPIGTGMTSFAPDNISRAYILGTQAVLWGASNRVIRDVVLNASVTIFGSLSGTNVTLVNVTGVGSATSNIGAVSLINSTFANSSLQGGTGSGVGLSGNRNVFDNVTVVSSGAFALGFSPVGNTTFNHTTISTNGTWLEVDVPSDGNTFTDTTFVNQSGSVNFAGVIALPSSTNITQAELNLQSNKTRVNSTTDSYLNTSAQITLRNLSIIDPRPVADFADSGVFSPCDPPTCVEISFAGGVYVFNVSHFTSFAAQENVTFVINLSADKADSPDPVARGGQLSYTVTLNNTGNATAQNVTVFELYPSGVVFVSGQPTPSGNATFSVGNLAPGQSFVVNITVNVSSALANGTILNNTVNVTFANSSGQNSSFLDSELTTVLGAPLLIAIKNDNPDPVVKGGVLNYSIFVNNTGDDTAFNVTVNEVYPSGVSFTASAPAPSAGNNTFTIGTLAPNQTVTINVSVVVGSNLINGTILNNSVNATWRNSTGQQGRVSDSELTTVIGFPQVTVAKTDSPDPITQGNVLSYTITVTNAGDEIAYNVTALDVYPGNIAFVTSSPAPSSGNDTFSVGVLLPGQSIALNITVNVSSTFTGLLTNNVNVTFANVSGETSTLQAAATTTVVAPPTPGPSGGGGGGSGSAGFVRANITGNAVPQATQIQFPISSVPRPAVSSIKQNATSGNVAQAMQPSERMPVASGEVSRQMETPITGGVGKSLLWLLVLAVIGAGAVVVSRQFSGAPRHVPVAPYVPTNRPGLRRIERTIARSSSMVDRGEALLRQPAVSVPVVKRESFLETLRKRREMRAKSAAVVKVQEQVKPRKPIKVDKSPGVMHASGELSRLRTDLQRSLELVSKGRADSESRIVLPKAPKTRLFNDKIRPLVARGKMQVESGLAALAKGFSRPRVRAKELRKQQPPVRVMPKQLKSKGAAHSSKELDRLHKGLQKSLSLLSKGRAESASHIIVPKQPRKWWWSREPEPKSLKPIARPAVQKEKPSVQRREPRRVAEKPKKEAKLRKMHSPGQEDADREMRKAQGKVKSLARLLKKAGKR